MDQEAEVVAIRKEVENLLPTPDSLIPLHSTPIPDNPPPHEGALFDLPFIIEPPDLLLIEVLETLPGRPIRGERLVRPDGTISLGFYGELHVRGLTLDQAKQKVVIHLRKFIIDEVLGLVSADPSTGKLYAMRARSERVFVDVTSYNSKYYYVQGDVAHPGKMPITGSECVLDAIHYAGGFLSTFDPKAIQLFRPARGGKPARTYAIDMYAIEKGDAKANYQLFPGDRLNIGRDRRVKATIEVDRQATMMQTVINSGIQVNLLARGLEQATPGLTPAEREEYISAWLTLWEKSVQAQNIPIPDMATIRDMISLPMRFRKPAKTDEPAKK